MTSQEVPGAGHDTWGGGAPQAKHPRAQELPAAAPGDSALRLTLSDGAAGSLRSADEQKDGEAISLGGFRQVLIIAGILATGLLLAFLIHVLTF